MKKLLLLFLLVVSGCTAQQADPENLGASVLFPYQGGTGTNTVPAANDILIGDGSGKYVVDQLSDYTSDPNLIATSTDKIGTPLVGSWVTPSTTKNLYTPLNLVVDEELGVNTTTPQYPLHVVDESSSTTDLRAVVESKGFSSIWVIGDNANTPGAGFNGGEEPGGAYMVFCTDGCGSHQAYFYQVQKWTDGVSDPFIVYDPFGTSLGDDISTYLNNAAVFGSRFNDPIALVQGAIPVMTVPTTRKVGFLNTTFVEGYGFQVATTTLLTGTEGIYATAASSTLGQIRFNDDGTNTSIGWGRNLGQLQLKDALSVLVASLYPSNDTVSAGLFVNGHIQAGRGTSFWLSQPQTNIVLNIAEDTADTWNSVAMTGGFTTGLQIPLQLNADMGQQNYVLSDLSFRLNAGFDSTDFAGGGLASTLTGVKYSLFNSMSVPLVGSFSSVTMEDFNVNMNLQATPTAVTELIGIKFTALSITNPSPTRGVGIRFTAPGATTSWAVQSAGKIQMNTVTQLIFGGTNTAQGVNYISRGGTNDITMGLAALTNSHYNWSATNYTPLGTIRTQYLGNVTTQGWAGVYLQDTAASFTLLLQTTNTGITGNKILTLDVGNGNQTLKWNTAGVTVTIDDWFNQSVKTTASPQFNGVGLGAALPATTWLRIAASAAGYSQIQLASGTAPTSPVDGDIWKDSGDGLIHFEDGLYSIGATTTVGFTASTTLLIIDGHIHSGGDAPTATECGTTPTFATNANDNAGKVTAGSGTATACKIAFRYTWNAAPSCVITGDLTTVLASSTTTGLNLYFGGSNGAGGVYMYQCQGLRR